MQTIPRTIVASPLMRRGGFGVYAGLVDVGVQRRMLAEAVGLMARASDSRVDVSRDGQERGGEPARRLLTASAGAEQRRFYWSPSTIAFLRSITHRSLQPTGGVGTYSYYARPGDFLALHRDIVTCDVAVITCLSDAPAGAPGGQLCLYPGRASEPIQAIRTTPSRGAERMKLAAGQTIVLYGGIVPHALLPVAAGQVRIVSVLCYRIPSA